MQNQQTAPTYQVWGPDNIAYGPFELPGLVPLVKQRRVVAGTWVFLRDSRQWVTAGTLPELKMFFEAKTAAPAAAASDAVKPENLRRIKIFAEMDHPQLESLLGYVEVVRVAQHTQLFKRGDHADAMYCILEGEVRAALQIEGRETTLFTLGAGESFGETALLAKSERAADIHANSDCVLLKLPDRAFERITREAPALATPFLLAISRTITNRSLDLGKRYEHAIRSARVASDLHI